MHRMATCLSMNRARAWLLKCGPGKTTEVLVEKANLSRSLRSAVDRPQVAALVPAAKKPCGCRSSPRMSSCGGAQSADPQLGHVFLSFISELALAALRSGLHPAEAAT